MLSHCYNKVLPCIDPKTGETVPDPDSPFRNLSAERPDTNTFTEVVFDGGNEDDPKIFVRPGCLSLCVSDVSAEEAEACARRQAAICNYTPPVVVDPPVLPPDGPWDPPPDGPGTNTPGTGNPGTNPPGEGTTTPPDGPKDPNSGGGELKFNTPQTCVETCPDGSTFSKTIPAGQFVALTQALADAQAMTAACKAAKAEKICIDEMPGSLLDICTWTTVEGNLYIIGNNAPYTVTVTGGQLPPGLNLQSLEGGTGVKISGVPQGGGTFDFKIKAEDQHDPPNFQEKQFQIRVRGISQESGTSMADGLINSPYNYAFTATGPFVEPVHWVMGGAPEGLTMDYWTGAITGSPTQHGAFLVSVTVQDAMGRICGGEYHLYVFDCTLDTFTAEKTWDFGCNTVQETTWDIPPALCARSIHFLSDNLVTNCGAANGCNQVVGLQVRILVPPDYVAEASNWVAANQAPFDPSMSQFANIPAQLEANAMSYRVVINFTGGGGPSCSGAIQLRAIGY